MSNWRRLKVVVEVPVKGAFTEHDLAWAVKRILKEDGFWHSRSILNEYPVFGRVEVKEWNKVIVWYKRKNK